MDIETSEAIKTFMELADLAAIKSHLKIPEWTAVLSGSTFTAVAGARYLIYTSSYGAITCNLPSGPSVGDEVMFMDAERYFNTNSLTIGYNSNYIEAAAENLLADVAGATVRLVFVGGNKGWRVAVTL